MRSRSRDVDAQNKQRLADREQDLQRESFLDRRASYIALHTAAWSFRLALKGESVRFYMTAGTPIQIA